MNIVLLIAKVVIQRQVFFKQNRILSRNATLECSLVMVSLFHTAPPGITMSPSNDLERWVGERVSFTCVVEGIPTPTITWYHNAEQLSAGGVISIRGNTLTISSLAFRHTGMFQCLASNMVGSIQRSWAVQVRTSGEHMHTHIHS